MFKFDLNVNRSGKQSASPATPSPAECRIIPFASTQELPDMSIIFTDIYGTIWSPSQLVQQIREMGWDISLILGFAVQERERSADTVYYDLLATFEIDQISEEGSVGGKPAVTVLSRHAPVGNYTNLAGMYQPLTLQFIGQDFCSQNTIVVVPSGIIPPPGSATHWWEVSIDMSNGSAAALGTVTAKFDPNSPQSYPAIRSPVGTIVGDDMPAYRFKPYYELNIMSGATVTSSGGLRADLQMPLAVSADGQTVYFAGYYSEPQGQGEGMEPVLQYAILSQSQSGPVNHALEVANAAVLTLGIYTE